MGFFSIFLGKNLKKTLIGLGISILIIGIAYVYITSLKSDITDLQAENTRLNSELTKAVDINKENSQTIELMKKDIKARDNSIVRLNRELTGIQRKSEELENYINNITEEQNGPIAPVLRHTIEVIQSEQSSQKGKKK